MLSSSLDALLKLSSTTSPQTVPIGLHLNVLCIFKVLQDVFVILWNNDITVLMFIRYDNKSNAYN